ncbi:hypothetical protein BDN72DRAFT_832725 [Pluteus cervinus]|uniref:Uncharacterized protein n=1 Tax=Pluteus cervinus TaxID=181527 RepID=A0ACD3BAD4_9AGAR|nr:hypothetical protein BDN72DRAFT_832725 [Pluteus cervinus]
MAPVLRASISVESFRLKPYLAKVDTGPSLLADSPSLDSLSSLSSAGSVPPFPKGHEAPVQVLVCLRSRLKMFPRGLSLSNAYGDSEDNCNPLSRLMISVPTPGRLDKILNEPICVSTWARRVTICPAPGHVPWEPSFLAHETRLLGTPFRRSSKAPLRPSPLGRGCLDVHDDDASQRNSSNSARPSKPFRDALIFEREITLTSGGESQRWSLQVPASSMEPEMVDCMLELRSLKTFFKNDTPEKGATDTTAQRNFETPSLMVSNSHYALPLSLESFDDLSPSAPVPLAIRRGQKMLPPLTATQTPTFTTIDNPTLPTPLAGSPLPDTPVYYDLPTKASDCGLSLEIMKRNLRSYCLPIYQITDETIELDYELSGTTLYDSSPRNEPENGVVVAKDLLPGLGPKKRIHSRSVTPDDGDCSSYSMRVVAANSGFSINTLASTCGDVQEESRIDHSVHGYQSISNLLASGPPSGPLPPIPVLCSTSSREIRGILKSNKSVRFAESPTKRQTITSASSSERVAPSPPAAPPAQRPLSLRNPTTIRATPPPLSAPITPSRTTTTTTNRTFGSASDSEHPRILGHARTPAHTFERLSTPPKGRPVSTPTIKPPSPPKRLTFSGKKENHVQPFSIRSYGTNRRATVSTSSPQTEPQTPKAESNKTGGRLSFSASKASRDRVMNTTRRTSESTSSALTGKSKMGTPFRNILTRFR